VSNVRDIDKGYRRIMKELGWMSKHTIVAGVSDSGDFSDLSDREPGDLKGLGRAPTLTEKAAIHEYGTQDGKVPARSFLRSTMDENEGKYATAAKVAVQAVIQGSSASKQLEKAADAMTNDIKRKIDSGIPPALKASTLRAKARRGQPSTPLIAEGDLKEAVQGKVVRK
jgi:phage gpG-like protein